MNEIQCDPSNFLDLVSIAEPGDCFVLNPGDYPDFNGCPAGIEEAPIIIQGQQGVKFRKIGFYGSQYAYVILDSILVDGHQCIFGQGAHHLTLQNSEVCNIHGGEGIAGGIEMYGVNDCVVLNTFVHHTGSRPNYDHGIYMYGLRNRIEDCRIEDVAAYGIHNYSGGKPNDGNIIRGNHITRNGVLNPTQSVYAIISSSGNDNLIEFNTCEHVIGGITSGSGSVNISIRRNTILDVQNIWAALELFGSGSATDNKVDPSKVIVRSQEFVSINNNLDALGADEEEIIEPPPTEPPPEEIKPPTETPVCDLVSELRVQLDHIEQMVEENREMLIKLIT